MPALAFGSVDVLAGVVVDTTSTITATCSGGGGTGQRLCISIDAGSAGDATSRQLVSGGNTIRFDIYSNSGRTQLWGSWQTGYDTAGVTVDVPQNSTTPITVYGRLFGSQQTVVTGSYSSTFTVSPFIQYRNNNNTPCPAGGKTANTSTSATATVIANCLISTTNINFGSTSSLASNIDANGAVTATCTNTTPYNIGLSVGTGTGATVAARKMTSGAKTITYSLYTNSTRTTVWGNTIGTDTVSGTGNGTNASLTVYGRVPAQTVPAAAAYSDTVVVTVTF